MTDRLRVIRALWNGYRLMAVTILSTVVFVTIVNAALSLMFLVKDRRLSNPVASQYGESAVTSAYQGLDAREIDALLEETWSRRYEFEPFTHFKETAFRG